MEKLPRVGVVISTNLRRQISNPSWRISGWAHCGTSTFCGSWLQMSSIGWPTPQTAASWACQVSNGTWSQQNCGGFGVSAMDILQPNVGCLKPRFEEHRRGGSALQPESELWSTVLCLQPARMAQDWLKIYKPYQDRSFQLYIWFQWYSTSTFALWGLRTAPCLRWFSLVSRSPRTRSNWGVRLIKPGQTKKGEKLPKPSCNMLNML